MRNTSFSRLVVASCFILSPVHAEVRLPKVISSQISMQFIGLPANVLGSVLQQDTKFTETLIQSIATGLGVDAVSVQIADIVVEHCPRPLEHV